MASSDEKSIPMKKWNGDASILKAHNCYDFALEHLDVDQKRKSQPGVRAGMDAPKEEDFYCPKIAMRIEKDFPEAKRLSGRLEACPRGMSKVALVVDPGKDYHFYRETTQKGDNTFEMQKCAMTLWEHKPGEKTARHIDGAWELIKNPEVADRNSAPYLYTDFCGYFCLPKLNDNTFAPSSYTN